MWWFAYDGGFDESTSARYAELMTPEECERHRRFVFQRDRDLFLATRALARTTLSRYADVQPAGWRFVSDGYGKPSIAQPPATPALHFNLANTPGMVACAVSVAHAAVGVDVEGTARAAASLDIADRFFSPAETASLRALPPAAQPSRFLELWTLKESYIKARGLGLSLPLDAFTLTLDGPHASIAFDARIADDPTHWRFASIQAGPGHVIAVGVDTCGAALDLRATRVCP